MNVTNCEAAISVYATLSHYILVNVLMIIGIIGGGEGGLSLFPSLHFYSSPPLFPLCSPLIPFPILPLEVGPLKSRQRIWGKAVSSLSRVWGTAQLK